MKSTTAVRCHHKSEVKGVSSSSSFASLMVLRGSSSSSPSQSQQSRDAVARTFVPSRGALSFLSTWAALSLCYIVLIVGDSVTFFTPDNTFSSAKESSSSSFSLFPFPSSVVTRAMAIPTGCPTTVTSDGLAYNVDGFDMSECDGQISGREGLNAAAAGTFTVAVWGGVGAAQPPERYLFKLTDSLVGDRSPTLLLLKTVDVAESTTSETTPPFHITVRGVVFGAESGFKISSALFPGSSITVSQNSFLGRYLPAGATTADECVVVNFASIPAFEGRTLMNIEDNTVPNALDCGTMSTFAVFNLSPLPTAAATTTSSSAQVFGVASLVKINRNTVSAVGCNTTDTTATSACNPIVVNLRSWALSRSAQVNVHGNNATTAAAVDGGIFPTAVLLSQAGFVNPSNLVLASMSKLPVFSVKDNHVGHAAAPAGAATAATAVGALVAWGPTLAGDTEASLAGYLGGGTISIEGNTASSLRDFATFNFPSTFEATVVGNYYPLMVDIKDNMINGMGRSGVRIVGFKPYTKRSGFTLTSNTFTGANASDSMYVEDAILPAYTKLNFVENNVGADAGNAHMVQATAVGLSFTRYSTPLFCGNFFANGEQLNDYPLTIRNMLQLTPENSVSIWYTYRCGCSGTALDGEGISGRPESFCLTQGYCGTFTWDGERGGRHMHPTCPPNAHLASTEKYAMLKI